MTGRAVPAGGGAAYTRGQEAAGWLRVAGLVLGEGGLSGIPISGGGSLETLCRGV